MAGLTLPSPTTIKGCKRFGCDEAGWTPQLLSGLSEIINQMKPIAQQCYYGDTSSKYVGRGGKFYRRGAAGPENIVIDNSKAEMKVINCVYPKTATLLFKF